MMVSDVFMPSSFPTPLSSRAQPRDISTTPHSTSSPRFGKAKYQQRGSTMPHRPSSRWYERSEFTRTGSTMRLTKLNYLPCSLTKRLQLRIINRSTRRVISQLSLRKVRLKLLHDFTIQTQEITERYLRREQLNKLLYFV